jgi:DNA-binding NarL/FixJ family response regulator
MPRRPLETAALLILSSSWEAPMKGETIVSAPATGTHRPRMRPIRLLLVDDQPLVREGLRKLLAESAEIEVVAEAGTVSAALGLCQQLHPDLLIIDATLPEMAALPLIREVRVQCPKTQVLALVECSAARCRVLQPEARPMGRCVVQELDPGATTSCMELALLAGARGAVRKTSSSRELLKAIRAVARGERWVEPTAALRLLDHLDPASAAGTAKRHSSGLPERLTRRELEVIRELMRGASNREIARALGVHEQTVKNAISRVLAKLDLADRVQLVLYAVNTRLLARHGALLPERARR